MYIGYGLVTTFTDPNAFTVSREMFVTAQTLCTAIDDWVGLVYCTIWLGYNARFHGNIAYALQIFEASVGQAQSIHDRRGMGLLWCHIGFIRAVEGDAVPEQLAKIRAGNDILRAVSDSAGELDGVHTLLTALRMTGQQREAIGLLRQYRERIVAHGNPLQQLLYADAVAMLADEAGLPVFALGILGYLNTHRSTHAHYRHIRTELVAGVPPEVMSRHAQAAAELTSALRAMEHDDALRAIFTIAIGSVAARFESAGVAEQQLFGERPRT